MLARKTEWARSKIFWSNQSCENVDCYERQEENVTCNKEDIVIKHFVIWQCFCCCKGHFNVRVTFWCTSTYHIDAFSSLVGTHFYPPDHQNFFPLYRFSVPFFSPLHRFSVPFFSLLHRFSVPFFPPLHRLAFPLHRMYLLLSKKKTLKLISNWFQTDFKLILNKTRNRFQISFKSISKHFQNVLNSE